MITATMVQNLREKTGAGMLACKKALDEANGDEKLAIEILKKKGESKAIEKSYRQTSQGLITIKTKGRKISASKILCETDFVARNYQMKSLGEEICDMILSVGEEKAKISGEEKAKSLIGRIGENIILEEVILMEGSVVGYYLHPDFKKAGIVCLEGGTEQVAKDLAMHVVGMMPKYINPEDFKEPISKEEKDEIVKKLEKEGKPLAIIENIIKGKESKIREENSFYKQSFVKDNTITCGDYLKIHNAKIVSFRHISV